MYYVNNVVPIPNRQYAMITVVQLLYNVVDRRELK
jgi:hypothetical protein